MEQQPSSQPRPEDSPYNDPPHIQHARPPRTFGGWNPIAPTPDMGDVGSPGSVSPDSPGYPTSPPRATGISYVPFPTNPDAARPYTPSSIGLGIDPASQSGGYHPVYSRDPFQVVTDTDSPRPGGPSPKVAFQTQEHPMSGPETTAYYSSKSSDSSPPNGPEKPGFFAQWPKWRWVGSGWPMHFMFFLGVAFAGGHHAFYEHLDGMPADDQIRMMRFGALLSYASKSCLLAAVVFAYRQQVWVTARRKTLRLRTIDSLFAGVSEPLALLNLEFIKKAKVAVALAVLAWFFPLTVILIPATLTVGPLMETKADMCYGVRTLNFEAETWKNWRNTDRLNGFRGISMSLWNSTLSNSGTVFTPYNETFFDYWTGTSAQLDLVQDQSALTGNVVPRPNVAVETCGAGWNCSYTISFKAPGYKCNELARGRKLDEDKLKEQGVPFNAGELAPNGDYSYLANADLGEYYMDQIDVETGGQPKMKPPYPKNLGAFRTEPVVWIGYSIQTTLGKPPENRSVEGWDTAFEAAVFRCEHYLTDYTVQFNHTFSDQVTTILKREYLQPIIDTKFVPGKISKDGTKDNTTATPESNYVRPIDYERYRLTAAYHGLGLGMRNYLNGLIQYAPYALVQSEATKTRLIDTDTYLPVPNLMDEIQHFYENMTLSLLSNPQFVIVSWAANSTQRSGVGIMTDPALAYPCTKTRVANAYFYNRRDLWIAYTFAIVGAGICVVFGMAALSQNNYHLRNVHVSSIIAATRAPCLENLPWKSSKWGEVPDEILDTKLGYGVIADPGPNGTPALMGMSSPGGSGEGYVMAGKVYYGFAPQEVLERTRVNTFGIGPGKPRPRASALSFRTWEQGYFK